MYCMLLMSSFKLAKLIRIDLHNIRALEAALQHESFTIRNLSIPFKGPCEQQCNAFADGKTNRRACSEGARLTLLQPVPSVPEM